MAATGSGEEAALIPAKLASAPENVWNTFKKLMAGFRNLGFPDNVNDPVPQISGVKPIKSFEEQIVTSKLKCLTGLPYDDIGNVCQWVLDGKLPSLFGPKDKGRVTVDTACKLLDIYLKDYKKMVTFRYSYCFQNLKRQFTCAYFYRILRYWRDHVFIEPAVGFKLQRTRLVRLFGFDLFNESLPETMQFARTFNPASSAAKTVGNPSGAFHTTRIQMYLGLEVDETRFVRPSDKFIPQWAHIQGNERRPSVDACSNFEAVNAILDSALTSVGSEPVVDVVTGVSGLCRSAKPFDNKRVLRRAKISPQNLLMIGAGTGSVSMLPVKGRALRFVLGGSYRLLSDVVDDFPSKEKLTAVYDEVRLGLCSFVDTYAQNLLIDDPKRYLLPQFQGKPVGAGVLEWLSRLYSSGCKKHVDFKVNLKSNAVFGFFFEVN